MNNEYVYNFTSNSGLILKDIFCSIEDKVLISFFYYSELEGKIIKEKSRKYKLYTTNKGYYFNYKNLRMYLNDFIKLCY